MADQVDQGEGGRQAADAVGALTAPVTTLKQDAFAYLGLEQNLANCERAIGIGVSGSVCDAMAQQLQAALPNLQTDLEAVTAAVSAAVTADEDLMASQP